MTTRSERDQRLRELKTGLMTRVAQRAMTTRKTGLDGLAKRMLGKPVDDDTPQDPELDHPDEWNRPIE